MISTHEASKAPNAIPSARGLRLTTPVTIRISKQAQAFRDNGDPRISRLAAWRQAKRAAAALGFGTAKLMLLDLLFSLSKAQDWTDADGPWPMVWPSNAWLASRTNLSETTVRDHLRDFHKAGLITYEDSPTGRRHGKRDADGRIIEAFGIDLSPLAIRHDELKALADAAEAEAGEISRLRDCATVIAKRIRSLLADALERETGRPHRSAQLDGSNTARLEQWHHGLARLDVIRERKSKDREGIERQLNDLEAFLESLEGLYDKAFSVGEDVLDVPNNRHRGAGYSAPYTYTDPESDSVNCNQNCIALTSDTQSLEARGKATQNKQAPVETDAHDDCSGWQSTVEPTTSADDPARTDNPSQTPDASPERDVDPAECTADAGHADTPQAQGAAAVAGTATQGPEAEAGPGGNGSAHSRGPASRTAESDDVLQLSIGLLRDACPAIKAIAPDALDHWQTLRDSGHALCAGTDINPQVFDEASDVLGPDIAIAATAVTVQKAAQGDVFKPGAYLRTLTKRGKAGELHIAKSLHGLAALNGMAAETENPDNETDRTKNPGDDNSANPPETGKTSHQASPSRRPDDTPLHDGAKGDGATSTGSASKRSAAFPKAGSIAYSPWADIVRSNAPEPVPDVDRVADAFRAFCNRHHIDTTSPNIKTVFTTFCRKWAEPR